MSERLFATTTPGLEEALVEECRGLVLQPKVLPGGVELEGPAGLHRTLNLQLRSAGRVLLRVGEFHAANGRALAEGLSRVPLGHFVPAGVPAVVSCSIKGSRLARKDLLEQAVRGAFRLQPLAAGEEEAVPRVFVRLAEDRCTVSVDTSGELLHRRGYRQEVSRAPLRESLAAGLLLLAGYDGKLPFWDPFCGSGTFVIEAALVARGWPPGMHRHFAFEHFPGFTDAERSAWEKERGRARLGVHGAHPPLHGTDIHAGALGAARRNARRAEVLDALHLERKDVAVLAPPAGMRHGVLVTNPPYGIRVGELQQLRPLYAAFGKTLRTAFHGWRVGVLAPEGPLLDAVGLQWERKVAVQNGGIRCTFAVGRP